jgi:hypothetical protein
MSGVFRPADNLLCPCAVIDVDGAQWTMRYTLRSMAAFEWRTGGLAPEASIVSLRAMVWSLLVPSFPDLDIRAVGAMSEAQFAGAIEAAGVLIAANTPSPRETAADTGTDKPTDWYGLWSIGRVDLGLSEAEFWGLAPIQWDALSRRLEARSEEMRYGHALVCSELYNSQRTSEDDPVRDPAVWMPGAKGEAARKQVLVDQRQALRGKIQDAAKLMRMKVTKK